MRKIRLYLAVLLGAICLPWLVWRLETTPAFWFDEGYKAHAAYQLGVNGFYGTATLAGSIPFDPGISGGPADLLPTAAVMWAGGRTVAAWRWPSVLYAVLAVLALTVWLAKSHGVRVAALVALLMLAAPAVQDINFILMSRQVLSEPAALAWVLVGWLAWWRGLRRAEVGWALVAGGAVGVGILSKTQWALPLWPAMAAFGLLWILTHPQVPAMRRVLCGLGPVLVAGMVYGLWQTGVTTLTPEAVRTENAAMLAEAIRSNLLTGLWGTTLTPAAQRMFWAMLAVVTLTTGRLLWRHRAGHWQTRDEVELFLAGVALLSAAWFALFSVGWPRYAYLGWLATVWLAALLAAHAVQALGRRFARARRPLWLGALAVSAALAVLIAPAEIARRDADPAIGTAARYIQQHVPRTARLETWEWEQDALSGHFNVSHPHQRYLFSAIRQAGHTLTPFDLGYDPLHADPDYLLIGPFATWTRLYHPAVVAEHFTLEADFGPYRLYRRLRDE